MPPRIPNWLVASLSCPIVGKLASRPKLNGHRARAGAIGQDTDDPSGAAGREMSWRGRRRRPWRSVERALAGDAAAGIGAAAAGKFPHVRAGVAGAEGTVGGGDPVEPGAGPWPPRVVGPVPGLDRAHDGRRRQPRVGAARALPRGGAGAERGAAAGPMSAAEPMRAAGTKRGEPGW